MSGPNKTELEQFFTAFGRWLYGPADGSTEGLADLIARYDAIVAAGAARRPPGRPPHLRGPEPEGTYNAD